MNLQTAPESLFWYWINERHAIYLKRAAGEPKPWTSDPILQDYKFTNPFRQLDRGTVWLREHFLEPHRKCEHALSCEGTREWFEAHNRRQEPPENRSCSCGARSNNLALLAFNICWYRMFNWWGTGALLGWRDNWPPNQVKGILLQAQYHKEQIFTGAHIVYSRPGFSKIDAIVDVCTELWEMRHQVVSVATETRSLQATFDKLREADSVGGFMAYEMVSDMRWTRLLEDATDILTWANPGPGAKRGLRRLGMPHTPDTAAIEAMELLLSRSQERPNALPESYPQLEMREIEHSLCEFDKYCRVKFGEGQPRSRFNGR